jgi:hypothetical protein
MLRSAVRVQVVVVVVEVEIVVVVVPNVAEVEETEEISDQDL